MIETAKPKVVAVKEVKKEAKVEATEEKIPTFAEAQKNTREAFALAKKDAEDKAKKIKAK